MKLAWKVLIILIVICFAFCNKNKCVGERNILSESFLEIIHDYSTGSNPVNMNPKAHLFIDSTSFYSTWRLNGSTYIDFNSNSCIYIHDPEFKQKKNSGYIEQIHFFLTETPSYYLLTLSFCTKKVLINKKSYTPQYLIKTKKLSYKQLLLEYKYE